MERNYRDALNAHREELSLTRDAYQEDLDRKKRKIERYKQTLDIKGFKFLQEEFHKLLEELYKLTKDWRGLLKMEIKSPEEWKNFADNDDKIIKKCRRFIIEIDDHVSDLHELARKNEEYKDEEYGKFMEQRDTKIAKFLEERKEFLIKYDKYDHKHRHYRDTKLCSTSKYSNLSLLSLSGLCRSGHITEIALDLGIPEV